MVLQAKVACRSAEECTENQMLGALLSFGWWLALDVAMSQYRLQATRQAPEAAPHHMGRNKTHYNLAPTFATVRSGALLRHSLAFHPPAAGTDPPAALLPSVGSAACSCTFPAHPNKTLRLPSHNPSSLAPAS